MVRAVVLAVLIVGLAMPGEAQQKLCAPSNGPELGAYVESLKAWALGPADDGVRRLAELHHEHHRRLYQRHASSRVPLIVPDVTVAYPWTGPVMGLVGSHDPRALVSIALLHAELHARQVENRQLQEAAESWRFLERLLGEMAELGRPESAPQGTGEAGRAAGKDARGLRGRLRTGKVGEVEYPAGSWVLPSREGLGDALRGVASELSLDFASAPSTPEVERHAAPPPRLGLWVPWADTDSIGWIRYTLDQRGVPYTYLRDEDVRAGGLREKVDMIVYGHVRLDLQAQIHGIEPVAGPMPFI